MGNQQYINQQYMNSLIDRLFETGDLPDGDFERLIEGLTGDLEHVPAVDSTVIDSMIMDPMEIATDGSANKSVAAGQEASSLAAREHLFEKTRIRQQETFGHDVYLRGLIEFTNYCRNDCYYCGIRRSNRNCQRYHLTKEEILMCCEKGYDLDFRTFVLQGGEDMSYHDEDICDIITTIKSRFPDCAVTLSIGEREPESYRKFREAGADRYLLRHETADPQLYARLHPKELSLEHRMSCLFELKKLGFQVGAGMMLQAPGQTTAHLVKDLRFLQQLQPEMIGIGPFIPHQDTPFRDEPAGTAELTIIMIAILRLMFPKALIPATTALGTIDPKGREKGILAGANVVMPNLSPADVRAKYLLYDGKISTGDEAAEAKRNLVDRIAAIEYEVKVTRGDAPGSMIE